MAQKPPASVSPEQSAIAATGSTMSEPTETTAERRDELASKLVDRFAIWSGVAGLIPVPLIDAVAVGGLQIQMLRRLSQIYGVAFSENRGKALIASLAGSMIPTTSGIGAASVLKAVPIVGTIVAGFVMPVLSAGATYAIGKAFIQHFASGGTLLDFNLPGYREFVKASKEMWDSRSTSSRRSAQPSSSSSSGLAETTTGAAATSS
ncbi:MAG: YcjF family protein [Candidatus Acidiferrales bacterium]